MLLTGRLTINKINVDKKNRGVDVEEADGIQDIGEQFTTIFGDIVIGEGGPEDFWYKSNPSKLYENKFSKNTRPNTNSNSGANSLITMSGFSEIGNRMSFQLSYGDSIVKPLFSNNLPIGSVNAKLAENSNNAIKAFYILSNDSLYKTNGAGQIVQSYAAFSSKQPAGYFNNNNEYIAGVKDSTLNIYFNNSLLTNVSSVNIGQNITSAPVILSDNVAVGTGNGLVKIFGLGVITNLNPVLTETNNAAENKIKVEFIAGDSSYYSFAGNSILPTFTTGFSVYDSKGNSYSSSTGKIIDFAVTKNSKGQNIGILLLDDNSFSIISEGKLVNSFKINTADTIKSFSVGDLKQDGNNYIVFASGNKIRCCKFKRRGGN